MPRKALGVHSAFPWHWELFHNILDEAFGNSLRRKQISRLVAPSLYTLVSQCDPQGSGSYKKMGFQSWMIARLPIWAVNRQQVSPYSPSARCHCLDNLNEFQRMRGGGGGGDFMTAKRTLSFHQYVQLELYSGPSRSKFGKCLFGWNHYRHMNSSAIIMSGWHNNAKLPLI